MADALDRNVWVPEPGCIATGIAGARLTSHPGWLPLTRKRPRLAAGFRLIEINVPVDTRSTCRRPFPCSRTCRLPRRRWPVDTRFGGVDPVLPSRLFRKSTIVKAQTVGPRGRWLADDQLTGRPLSESLPHGVRSDTYSYPVLGSP